MSRKNYHFFSENFERHGDLLLDLEEELLKAIREIDPISRKGVYLSALTQLNEAMREKNIRKDKRKKEILEKTTKTLTKAVAEM